MCIRDSWCTETYILKLRNKRIITWLEPNNNNLVWWKICMLRKLNLFLSPQFPTALCKVGLSGSYFRQDRNFNAVLLQIVCHSHKSDWFAKFFHCQCPGETMDKSLVTCFDSLGKFIHFEKYISRKAMAAYQWLAYIDYHYAYGYRSCWLTTIIVCIIWSYCTK